MQDYELQGASRSRKERLVGASGANKENAPPRSLGMTGTVVNAAAKKACLMTKHVHLTDSHFNAILDDSLSLSYVLDACDMTVFLGIRLLAHCHPINGMLLL